MLQGKLLRKKPLNLKRSVLWILRKQATNFAHQGLVRHQGEGHQSLVPLKGVQGVEFCEAFLENFVRILLRWKINETNNLGGISMVEGFHTVEELGEA